jgi:MFS family permease
MTMEPLSAAARPWYREIDGHAWRALLGGSLGWIFDGYETYTLILVAVPALHVLLSARQLPSLAFFQGLAIGLTLLGWAFGGIIWGVITDYIGRRRAMLYSIAMYAVFTGITAFSQTWWQLILFRFITGLGLGAEWATGASLVSERFPVQARAKAACLLQSGFGVGFLLSAVIWALVGPTGPQAWRWMFVIGSLPALLSLLFMARHVPESDRWEHVQHRRRAARQKRAAGHALSDDEHQLTQLTIANVFHSAWGRRTWIGIAISFSFTCGGYAVSTWIPAFAAGLAAAHHLNPVAFASLAAIYYNGAGILGYNAYGFLADAWGRRPVTAAYFILSCLLSVVLFKVQVPLGTLLFLAFVNGFFSIGVASVFPVLLPELFPTHMRATASAFIFNVSRFVAFLGPLTAGSLIVLFHGIAPVASVISLIFLVGAVAVWFLPETRGLPLPD